MLIIIGISNETRNELTIYEIICLNFNISPTRTSFFISCVGNMENVAQIQSGTFRLVVYK